MSASSPAPDSALSRIMSGPVPDSHIDLSIGEPDQPLPAPLAVCAVDTIRDHRTGYTPKLGLPRLRELVAADTDAPPGLRPAPADTVITIGGTGAVAVALLAAGRAGVAIPDPSWPNYRILAGELGIPIHPYLQGPSGDDFFDLDRIETALRAGARMVVVNSPSNPTAAVASSTALTELVTLVRNYDATILSDEAYEAIVFGGGRAPTPIGVGGLDVTFAARTFSKRFCGPGLRVGSLIAPQRFRDDVAAIHGTTAGCAPITGQLVGIAALETMPDHGTGLSAIYAQRYAAAAAALGPRLHFGTADSAPGIENLGGFYLWIDATDTGRTSAELTHALSQRGVEVSDGTVYASTDGYLRAALTAPDDQLATALGIIADELG